jgi:hypothetical protein
VTNTAHADGRSVRTSFAAHEMSERDYRDMVIEVLADSEAELIDRVVELTSANSTEREVRQAAIHHLADVTGQLARLREQHHRLLDQYRHLREQNDARVGGR